MTIELTPEMEAMVTKRVGSDSFENPLDVLRVAFLALEEQERADAEKLANFHAMMQQSLAEADRGDTVSAAEVFAELRELGRLMQQAAA